MVVVAGWGMVAVAVDAGVEVTGGVEVAAGEVVEECIVAVVMLRAGGLTQRLFTASQCPSVWPEGVVEALAPPLLGQTAAFCTGTPAFMTNLPASGPVKGRQVGRIAIELEGLRLLGRSRGNLYE